MHGRAERHGAAPAHGYGGQPNGAGPRDTRCVDNEAPATTAPTSPPTPTPPPALSPETLFTKSYDGANLRLGYAVDVINAAKALQQDPNVKPDQIALLGRSMGGGVTYTALEAAPGLFKAAIAYAPVSSSAVDNFEKWTRPDTETTRRVVAVLGEPSANPDAWAKASPRTYFGRITTPLMIHQGTADLSCPPDWAQASVEALRAAGKSVEYFTYPGQPHVFTTGPWTTSIQRSVDFLRQHLA